MMFAQTSFKFPGLVLAAAMILLATASGATPADVPLDPAHRIVPGAPEWRDLVELFAHQPDAAADFEEQRVFPFRKEPVTLRGEVRVSRQRGLSLHYTSPDEQVVIVDLQGLLVRTSTGETVPPDPRAVGGISALLHILNLDFAALEKEFEVFGQRSDATWSIVLVPRADGMRRAIGNIHVTGEAAVVRAIHLRRSARQHIDISLSAPRAPVTFSAEEMTRYFR